MHSRPESPRSVTGPSSPGDVSGKESLLNAHNPVRTIAGDPRHASPVPGMLGYRPQPPFMPSFFLPVLMSIPPAPPKRPNNEEESSNMPRKKARISSGKVDGSVGKFLNIPKGGTPFSHSTPAPKRGYTAKKRSEAAQIAAQNGL